MKSKYIFFILICTFALNGCNLTDSKFFKEVDNIESVVNGISKKNNSHITFEHIVNNDNRKLILTIHDKNGEDVFPGKILLETVDALAKKKIDHNDYEVVINNSKVLILTKEDLALIGKKYNYFKENTRLIITKDYDSFYALLYEELKNYSIEELTKNFFQLVQVNYPVFNGFRMENIGGYNFVIFKSSSTNNHNIMMSFKLDDDTNIIHGFQLE